MESLKQWLNLFPKTTLKIWNILSRNLDSNEKDSLFKRYIFFFVKRILVIFTCCNLIFYKNAVTFAGHIAGKYLAKRRIVPFHIYKPSGVKEDPGVTEMRAMLRGEDCFDHNLEQSQIRNSFPEGLFDPYEEKYLASYHLHGVWFIMRLLNSLKKHDEPFAQSFNDVFSWFDKFIVDYLNSEVIINKRD